jgi:hypothetical protein
MQFTELFNSEFNLKIMLIELVKAGKKNNSKKYTQSSTYLPPEQNFV